MRLFYKLLSLPLIGLLTMWAVSYSSLFSHSLISGACGTGFFINSHGGMATAAHVVGKNKTMWMYYKGQMIVGRVVGADYLNDVALINFDTNNNYLILKTNFAQGEVLIIGYPEPDKMGYFLHKALGHASIGVNLFVGSYKVNFSDIIYPGNSGSPIINENSLVVGVATNGYIGGMLTGGYGTPADKLTNLAYKIGLDINVWNEYTTTYSFSSMFDTIQDADAVQLICTQEN